jgi:hypothetical protein
VTADLDQGLSRLAGGVTGVVDGDLDDPVEM